MMVRGSFSGAEGMGWWIVVEKGLRAAVAVGDGVGVASHPFGGGHCNRSGVRSGLSKVCSNGNRFDLGRWVGLGNGLGSSNGGGGFEWCGSGSGDVVGGRG